MKPNEILEAMARTFEERGKIYGDNYKLIGFVLETMFPHGVHLVTANDHLKWSMFLEIVKKTCRLASAKLNHQDSIHDIGVYAAMFESIIKK